MTIKQAFILWSETYSVGNQTIDEQHQKMVGLINDFYVMVRNGFVYDEAEKKIDELIHYGESHFSFEETLLNLHNFDDLENHLALHKFYQDKIDLLRAEFRATEGECIDEIFAFLKNWWLGHITKADKEYTDIIY